MRDKSPLAGVAETAARLPLATKGSHSNKEAAVRKLQESDREPEAAQAEHAVLERVRGRPGQRECVPASGDLQDDGGDGLVTRFVGEKE